MTTTYLNNFLFACFTFFSTLYFDSNSVDNSRALSISSLLFKTILESISHSRTFYGYWIIWFFIDYDVMRYRDMTDILKYIKNEGTYLYQRGNGFETILLTFKRKKECNNYRKRASLNDETGSFFTN